jgi:hypothetical protein
MPRFSCRITSRISYLRPKLERAADAREPDRQAMEIKVSGGPGIRKTVGLPGAAIHPARAATPVPPWPTVAAMYFEELMWIR